MDKLQTPITAIILCNLELSETLCVKLQITNKLQIQMTEITNLMRKTYCFGHCNFGIVYCL